MSSVRISMVAIVSAVAIVTFGDGPASSQSFEMHSGQVSGPRTMAGAGDTGTVGAGGVIGAAGSDAVRMFNSGQRLTNDGLIGVWEDPADPTAFGAAVNSQGGSAFILNNGWVWVTSDHSTGILADGSDATIRNTGTLASFGTGNEGILGSGDNLSVSNSGYIWAGGEGASGIIWENFGGRLRVDNSGLIVVSGQAVNGIGALGGDVAVDNKGLVLASGEGAVGIGVVSDHSVIANTGSIFTEGAGNIALLNLGIGAVVTNSGNIFSDQGIAVAFEGSDATLNLLAGTAIQGPIVFDGAGNTVRFGRGLSAVMTFDGSADIETGGRPFAIDGETAAVVDVTGFASAGAVVEDLTGGVADAIGTHLSQTHDRDAGHRFRLWGTPFGVTRTQAASGPAAGFHDDLGGIVAGVDTDLSADILGGIFIGAAGGKTSVDGDAQDITHRSVFGGGYLAYDTGARFADASLTFGRLDESSRRRVADNLVLGGVEMASADYDGAFISPSLTLGVRMPYGESTLIPSLRLRYVGLSLDDYAETGAADGLSVAGRDIHLFTARGQLALAMPPVTASSGVWRTTWRAGLDGMVRNAGDVSANLLGQQIAFADGSRKQALRGFVGAGLSVSNGAGMTFGGDVETAYGSDHALIAHAEAHLDVAF